jgi:glycosyltransferase involved in cell wall biosynthesis
VTPTIHFDCRYIRVDHHDGISRFSAGLFSALSRLTGVVAIISDKKQLDHLPAGTEWVMLNDPTHWSEPFASLKLNKLGAEVVYSPMQTIGSFGRKFKLILTLHDLIYYSHPAPPPSMPLAVRIGWRLFHLTYVPQRLLLNAADAVVTVSQTSARLMRLHRLTHKPIHVVYNAADSDDGSGEQHAPKSRPSGPQRLVYMGSFMDYKNVQTLIKGMGSLADYELHLLSRITPARRAQLESIASQKGGALVFHNGVSEAEYHEILDGAVALVHASMDEGFGIPLVEAMCRGVPIVVSDIEIFHEIGGDAARYFNPLSGEAFAEKVLYLEHQDAWLAASEAGLAQAAKFSWETSAEALLEAINTL